MYFANNEGVLRFDGIHWDLIKVSESSPVRSVHVDTDNNIFVGLFNDFGLLHIKETGIVSFKSLRNLLPPEIDDFDNVWKIHNTTQGIVFQSFKYMFIYKDEKIKVIEPEERFQFSFIVGDRLFIHEPETGLYELVKGAADKVVWADQLIGKEIWGMLEIQENKLLIGTNNDGIYIYENGNLSKWNSPVNDLVEQYQLYSAVPLNGGYFAFGTILNGLIISDNQGEVVQHISIDSGLQNNTVLSVFTDSNQNLWLGLDSGIDYIEINSPVSFNFKFGKFGTGYTCRIFNENVYLGTNQGLFVKSLSQFSPKEEEFKLVENTVGQVWSLDIFEGHLICGHNTGTFLIRGNTAFKVGEEEGVWKYISLNDKREMLLGGHYNGLSTLKRTDNGWEFNEKVKGFDDSSRFLAQDSTGAIWISHGSKGVFRLLLNNELDSAINIKLYTSEHGLPADEQNILFSYNNKVYISTVNGIYKYQGEMDRFITDDQLSQFFNFEGQLKTLEVDSTGNIWFIAENESGVFRINEDLTYTKITLPFKPLDNRYVNGFEFVYSYNDDHTFFGIDNGFAHYSSKFSKLYTKPLNAFITKVEIPYMDSTVQLINHDITNNYKFPHNKNSFRFHYTAPFYEMQEQTKFSFLLDNYDEKWSDWSITNYKDFTNLPHGNYNFQVKARNIYGVESSVSSFPFRIMPPWYKTTAAKYAFVVLLLGFLFLALKFLDYRMELSEKRVIQKHTMELNLKEEKYQLQKLINEREIIQLRNEKLQGEMDYTNKELANQTMGIIQKNQFLVNLKDDLQYIQKSVSDGKVKKNLSGITRNINKEINNKQQNQVFETYFDEVHKDFFKRLKAKYAGLTPRDMRLCAYIRMNLTSKEIATLLNISDRGVEISRYRLRKKMELSRDINLSTFLSNI